jgi:hypothetical protein
MLRTFRFSTNTSGWFLLMGAERPGEGSRDARWCAGVDTLNPRLLFLPAAAELDRTAHDALGTRETFLVPPETVELQTFSFGRARQQVFARATHRHGHD